MLKGGAHMDKYEQLADSFEIEELEERIEFNSCDQQGCLQDTKSTLHSWGDSLSGDCATPS